MSHQDRDTCGFLATIDTTAEHTSGKLVGTNDRPVRAPAGWPVIGSRSAVAGSGWTATGDRANSPPRREKRRVSLRALVCVRIVSERIAGTLSKDDLIDMQGTVVAVHSGGLYRVQCDAGHEVLAQLSGRMRRFRIKVVPGDRVTVGVSPYDPVRGIITFRAR